MEAIGQALRGAASRARRSAPAERRGLVVGGGGSLGAALLEQALGCGTFAEVRALVVQPMDAALRGFAALPFDGFDMPLAPGSADTAWVVFDRERRANGREEAFYRPRPDEIATLARWLHAGGVRRLVIVLPHAPGLLPQAMRYGLATLDEQAVAAIGFEPLVIVRSAQTAEAERGGDWRHRVARLMLAQLRWMIPERDQAVRAERVAAFAVQVAVAAGDAPRAAATFVAPPELIWQAARSDDLPALVRQWLAGGAAA